MWPLQKLLERTPEIPQQHLIIALTQRETPFYTHTHTPHTVVVWGVRAGSRSTDGKRRMQAGEDGRVIGGDSRVIF